MLTAGVDVGGTNIQIGLVDDDHAVTATAKQKTPVESPEAVIQTIADVVKSFGEPVAAVGVGMPGAIHHGKVVRTPNLQGWHGGVDLAGELGASLGVPVVLGNDANVGLLGESVAGAAQGHRHILGLWLGTGVGGAVILNGQLYSGSLGAAGEIGHVIAVPNGSLCGCGRRGCVEAYAGRRGMATAIRSMADAGRPTSIFDIQEEEGKTQPTSRVWNRALNEGDALATEVFELAVEALAIGIASAINLLDLELVVIGGGLAQKRGSDLATQIGDAARPHMLFPNPDLEFVVGQLGDDAGIIGAAALARSSIDD